MNLLTEPYLAQCTRWPAEGRHILAQYDATTIVVYQAFRPEIAHYAAQNGRFGRDFSFNRMSWIKPNFLWMMYRSGWGSKPDQEVTLAIRLKRAAFDLILTRAVPSTFDGQTLGSTAEWKKALADSPVRVQWDPDHDPVGNPLARRAIQLGLGGEVLRQYGQEWIVEIQDISEFVRQQRSNAKSPYESLVTPHEDVYQPTIPPNPISQGCPS